MPSAIAPNPRAVSAAPDGSENHINYDEDVEDFLKDIPLDKNAAQKNYSGQQEPAKDIDEEITVKKKRRPVPKLDEARLLSDQGIPRLRKITKSQLKFRGKGHEFSDISRLLNTYQLWFDDLFPRAKFRDALTDAEKVGHSKRMQVMRRAWLDATKPQQRDASPERDDDFVMSGALPDNDTTQNQTSNLDSDNDIMLDDAVHGTGDQRGSERNNESNDAPEDDELDALLAENGNSALSSAAQPLQRSKGPFEEDSDDDELDALLAAEPTHLQTRSSESGVRQREEPNKAQDPIEDDFAAEEEVMAGMDMW